MNQFVDEAADALVVEGLGRAVAAGVRGALWTPPCADFLRRDNLPDRSGDARLVLAAAEDGQVGLEAREEEIRNADRGAEGVHLRGGGPGPQRPAMQFECTNVWPHASRRAEE